MVHPARRLAPSSYLLDDNTTTSFTPEETQYRAPCLVGKGSSVFGASINPLELAGMPLVTRVSWPHVNRLDEGTIIHRARTCAPGAVGYLSRAIGSCYGIEGETIRSYLDDTRLWKHKFRVRRITISERLEHIANLQGEVFLKAWWECVQCHFMVWEAGIHYHDLCVCNLMVRTKGDKKFGVVNDWDLSFVEDKSFDLKEHTATIPLVALDLLYRERRIVVEYRHGLESFAWILIWVLMSFQNGQEIIPNLLTNWQTGDFTACLEARLQFLDNRALCKPRNGWRNEQGIAHKLHQWLRRERHSQNEASLEEEETGVKPIKETNRALLSRFTGVIVSGWPAGFGVPSAPVRATDTP